MIRLVKGLHSRTFIAKSRDKKSEREREAERENEREKNLQNPRNDRQETDMMRVTKRETPNAPTDYIAYACTCFNTNVYYNARIQTNDGRAVGEFTRGWYSSVWVYILLFLVYSTVREDTRSTKEETTDFFRIRPFKQLSYASQTKPIIISSKRKLKSDQRNRLICLIYFISHAPKRFHILCTILYRSILI